MVKYDFARIGKLPEITGNYERDDGYKMLPQITENELADQKIREFVTKMVKGGLIKQNDWSLMREALSGDYYTGVFSKNISTCLYSLFEIGKYQIPNIFMFWVYLDLTVLDGNCPQYRRLEYEKEYAKLVAQRIKKVSGKIKNYQLNIRRSRKSDGYFEFLDHYYFTDLNWRAEQLLMAWWVGEIFPDQARNTLSLFLSAKKQLRSIIFPSRNNPEDIPEVVGIGLGELVPLLLNLGMVEWPEIQYIFVACLDSDIRDDDRIFEVRKFWQNIKCYGSLVDRDKFVTWRDLMLKESIIPFHTSLEDELEIKDLLEDIERDYF